MKQYRSKEIEAALASLTRSRAARVGARGGRVRRTAKGSVVEEVKVSRKRLLRAARLSDDQVAVRSDLGRWVVYARRKLAK